MSDDHAPQPWTVDLPWRGEAVVCIGGGPSLNDAQIDCVEAAWRTGRARVIAINDAWRLAPWADVLYACDQKWWQWHQGEVFDGFAGLMVTTDKAAAAKWPRLRYLPGRDGDGLSWDPSVIHWGRNSGHQAVNLAALAGAGRILLLGYDHQRSANGRSHWFGDHPDRVQSSYEHWAKDIWPKVPPSLNGHPVEIINCTPASAIVAFPMAGICEVLADE